MIIYKGKGIYRGWTSTVDDADTLFAHSDKGFITDNLALDWLHHFDTWTSIRAAGAPRFLLLGGHRTHYSLQFIRYAVAHDIILMSYPGHSTHLLQPLDVALFAPLQSAYGSAVATHTRTTRTGINKALFWDFYKLAKHEAYTKNNIKSAWRATGVYPFNPNKVLAELEKKNTGTKQLGLPLTAAPPSHSCINSSVI